MNVERAAAGRKALMVDADLTEAAQDYTDDMAVTGTSPTREPTAPSRRTASRWPDTPGHGPART
ncbi:CAP domain-containing protein [Streptomyces sp. NPDC056191]|uniref:CAP domain-containing protein n=1 Tax=Streptomyces sp. NPDC056191 TaxID=3345742 RepID=UPI0035D98A19